MIDGLFLGSDSSGAVRPSASPERVARRGRRWADATCAGSLPSWVSRPLWTGRAKGSGATNCPLRHEHLGGTCASVPGHDGHPHLDVVFSQLALVSQQIARAYREIDRLTAALAPAATASEDEPGRQGQRDVEILSSLPGVGRIVLATLLAEAHDPLQRRDYQALRCLSGTAPVTRRSGKSVIVVRRLAAHNRLQNAAYHWAGSAIQHDAVSRAKYTALRARGHGHARTLRSVADRLLAVACAMLENQTLFAPDHPGRRHAA